MPTFIALLRAAVRTYIASGNVIFDSTKPAVQVNGTARNMNTITKLVAMA